MWVPVSVCISVGMTLAQIGEFAFILAAHGKFLGLVSDRLYTLLLHTTVVSLIATPFLIRAAPMIFASRCVEKTHQEKELDV